MPALTGLPHAGQVMLGILAFGVIVWMTEALDYAVSSVVIGALMVFLLAYAPDAAKPSGLDIGTGAALNLALSGFSNSAVALVAAACFIGAAMTATGLDQRIATEKTLHNFDTSSTTIAAIALMLVPRIGVMNWKESQRGFPWGTVILFAIGISVGTALLKTNAAGWLANLIVHNLGLQQARIRDPDAALAVPDRDSPGVRERDRTSLDHDPNHHQRAHGGRDTGHQRDRLDHAPAVRGELRFHIARERAAEHDRVQH
jgi:di/tricarboxylate transporter